MENNKCLVLISGGIDSAVALFWAKYSGMVCEGLTFMYNNQAKAEKKAIQYICKNSNKHGIIYRFYKHSTFKWIC